MSLNFLHLQVTSNTSSTRIIRCPLRQSFLEPLSTRESSCKEIWGIDQVPSSVCVTFNCGQHQRSQLVWAAIMVLILLVFIQEILNTMRSQVIHTWFIIPGFELRFILHWGVLQYNGLQFLNLAQRVELARVNVEFRFLNASNDPWQKSWQTSQVACREPGRFKICP